MVGSTLYIGAHSKASLLDCEFKENSLSLCFSKFPCLSSISVFLFSFSWPSPHGPACMCVSCIHHSMSLCLSVSPSHVSVSLCFPSHTICLSFSYLSSLVPSISGPVFTSTCLSPTPYLCLSPLISSCHPPHFSVPPTTSPLFLVSCHLPAWSRRASN